MSLLRRVLVQRKKLGQRFQRASQFFGRLGVGQAKEMGIFIKNPNLLSIPDQFHIIHRGLALHRNGKDKTSDTFIGKPDGAFIFCHSPVRGK